MRMFRRLVLVTTALVLAYQPVSVAAEPQYEAPPANAGFDYQLGGSYRPVASVRVVGRDRTSHPLAGHYNICYINGFQTQDYQAEWWMKNHNDLLLHDANGDLVGDPNWPGEYMLDTSTDAKRQGLIAILGKWIDGCAAKGFDATDPDNLDSSTRSHHLLTFADNLAFATLLAERAHADGLAIGQKNYSNRSARIKRSAHFDFAITESCQVYDECTAYTDVYGDEVFDIEYQSAAYKAACNAYGDKISIIRRDHNLVSRGQPGYLYKSC